MSKFSRRRFCQVVSVVTGGTIFYPLTINAVNSQRDEEKEILTIFEQLPGQKAMKVQTLKNNTLWNVKLNENLPLFCASSFKVYVLAEFLRQMEDGKVQLTDKLVVSDEMRSPSSSVFEELSGNTTALIALEAMIMHSDNTATDLLLRHLSPEAVRAFIQEIGLDNTFIPDSTRIFFSYLLGADNNTDLGWKKISEAINSQELKTSRTIINNQQTMISTPANFVSFYSRALEGEFFKKSETLMEFKRILALPSILGQFIPDGAFGYVKGGSINFPPQFALSVAGGVRFSNNHWAYYSFLINWDDKVSKSPSEIQNNFAEAIAEILKITKQVIT